MLEGTVARFVPLQRSIGLILVGIINLKKIPCPLKEWGCGYQVSQTDPWE